MGTLTQMLDEMFRGQAMPDHEDTPERAARAAQLRIEERRRRAALPAQERLMEEFADRFESIRKRAERDPRDLRAAFALACYERALTDALYVDFDSYPSMLADSGCDLLEAGIGNREDDAQFWATALVVWRQMRDSGNYEVPESLKHQELRMRVEATERTVAYNETRMPIFQAALRGESAEYSVEEAEYVIARMDRESRNYAEVSAELEAQEARERIGA